VRRAARRPLGAFGTLALVASATPAFAAPPGIPGEPSGAVVGNRVTLSWAAALDDEGVTGYNVYRDDRYLTTVAETRYVAELGAGGTTSFYITAFDTPSDGSARGFSNRSPIATFSRGTVAPEPDAGSPGPVPAPPPVDTTRPPTVTGLVSRAASRDGVSLVWSASAADIVGYNVYRDGDYLTTVNGTSAFTDTRLPAAAESVIYNVVAFDDVPNFSPYSEPLFVALAEPEPGDDPAPPRPPQDDDPGTPPGDGTGVPNEPGPDDEVELGPYNRTRTEALSVQANGPSRSDPSRSISAPSAPVGLVALLTADNWVELDWVPSADDGWVIAYEIYRDDQLVATIDDQPNPPRTEPRVEELRALRTTTYIDCNFTKDLNCFTVGQPRPGTTHRYRVVAIDDTGLRSAPSAPLDVTLNTIEGAAPPDPLSEGYTLAFGDDFDAPSLDRRHWQLKMPWGPETIVNGETQYFVDAFANEAVKLPYNPFVMAEDPQAEDGRALRITAVPTPPELLERANGQPYLSGVITTRDKPSGAKRYGYVEMRAKVPSGQGLLSTFYLFQPRGNQYEIDILEYLGAEPDGATQNYHYRDGFRYADTGFTGVAHASPTMELDTGVDLSERYRTYSVLWEEELVIWYIDGVEVRRLTGPRVSDQPMDIIAQLVVGSRWIGAPTGVDFPVSYDIDYIRHWQK